MVLLICRSHALGNKKALGLPVLLIEAPLGGPSLVFLSKTTVLLRHHHEKHGDRQHGVDT